MRNDRVQVTVSQPMKVALNILAERSGLTVSAQAAMMLRQALARTIESAEAQRQIRLHIAGRTRDQWQHETMTEHAIETTYKALSADGIGGLLGGEEAEGDTAPASATADHLRGGGAGQADALAGEGLPRTQGRGEAEATA